MTSKKQGDEHYEKKVVIDGIPALYVEPEKMKGIALWIPYLGGTRETGVKELVTLSKHGFVAISMDPWMHGEREIIQKPSIRTRALKDFRAVMWQVLGMTVLDAFKIVDWAVTEFGEPHTIVAGGLSMGGDIAISLAGIDKRIRKVAGIASSPDWYRKGMTEVMDSTKILEQGQPSEFSQWLCNALNPMLNISHFSHDVAMHLEYGKRDTHIASKWAQEFKRKIDDSKQAKASIEIAVKEDLTHISIVQKKSVINRAIEFLCA